MAKGGKKKKPCDKDVALSQRKKVLLKFDESSNSDLEQLDMDKMLEMLLALKAKKVDLEQAIYNQRNDLKLLFEETSVFQSLLIVQERVEEIKTDGGRLQPGYDKVKFGEYKELELCYSCGLVAKNESDLRNSIFLKSTAEGETIKKHKEKDNVCSNRSNNQYQSHKFRFSTQYSTELQKQIDDGTKLKDDKKHRKGVRVESKKGEVALVIKRLLTAEGTRRFEVQEKERIVLTVDGNGTNLYEKFMGIGEGNALKECVLGDCVFDN